jgi:hypothetical protein
MLILNKYFYKNNKSKLCIGDRVAVLNDMFYEYGGSKKQLYALVDAEAEILIYIPFSKKVKGDRPGNLTISNGGGVG